jgi:hypothetical protein
MHKIVLTCMRCGYQFRPGRKSVTTPLSFALSLIGAVVLFWLLVELM